MPLPNTRIIPEGWSQHHQPAVQTSMRSRVDILKPLADAPEPTFPPSDEEWEPVAVADVPARIRTLAHGNDLAQSGQANDRQQYLIQIPAVTLPGLQVGADGHRIQVTSNPELPGLKGQEAAIEAVQHGTEAFNMDVLVSVHVSQEQG